MKPDNPQTMSNNAGPDSKTDPMAFLNNAINYTAQTKSNSIVSYAGKLNNRFTGLNCSKCAVKTRIYINIKLWRLNK